MSIRNSIADSLFKTAILQWNLYTFPNSVHSFRSGHGPAGRRPVISTST
ncbi:hypothetical protein [Paenibacillus jilunlii]|nr:hypothetical protein [Paenibacillus jilunlii]